MKVKVLFMLLIVAGLHGLALAGQMGAVGDLYVVGYLSHAVHQYDPNTGQEVNGVHIVYDLQTQEPIGFEERTPWCGGLEGFMHTPTVAVFSPHTGNILIGNLSGGDTVPNNLPQVVECNGVTGLYIGKFIPPSSSAPLENSVAGLCFRPNGNLLVSSFGINGSGKILEYNGKTGEYIGVFVNTGAGGLVSPKGIEYGPDGNLYVCESATAKILKYDGITGAYLGEFVAHSSGGLNGPTDLEFGGPSDNLFVGDIVGHVIEYNGRTGAYLRKVVDDSSFGYIEGIAIGGPNDHIFITVALYDMVMEYDPNTGEYIRTLVESYGAYPNLNEPQRLLFKPDLTPQCGDFYHPYPAGDMNSDCYVNLEDFALFARWWMECTHPLQPCGYNP